MKKQNKINCNGHIFQMGHNLSMDDFENFDKVSNELKIFLKEKFVISRDELPLKMFVISLHLERFL